MPTQAPSPTIKQLWILDGRFNDQQDGVSFRYPSVWRAGGNFTLWIPALPADSNPGSGAAFRYGTLPGIDDTAPYVHTTLRHFGIVYAPLSATDRVTCEADAAALAGSGTVNHVSIAGRRFSERALQQLSLGEATSGSVYSTYLHHTCFLFEASVTVSTNPFLDDALTEQRQNDEVYLKVLSAVQSNRIDRAFREIMQSVCIRAHGNNAYKKGGTTVRHRCRSRTLATPVRLLQAPESSP